MYLFDVYSILCPSTQIVAGSAKIINMKQHNISNLAVSRYHPFIRRIERTISAHDMLGEDESVLIGVSGGADSVAMLYGILALSGIYRWRIGVAHLDHGLRGSESDADAGFVEAVAKKLELPFYKEKTNLHARNINEGVNLEEAGREARYEFFDKIADQAGYDKIAVGHQQQDAAEQVVLNLLRGTGPDGLGGLASVRGRVIRPLIETPRREIEQFLQDKKISCRFDQSNADNSFTRNRVRNCLIPELQSFNPGIEETLLRLSAVMRKESEWIDDIVAGLYEAAVIRRNPEFCELTLSVNKISSLHRAALRRLMRKAILEVKGDLRRIGYQHIEDVISLVSRQSPGFAQIHLPGRIRAVRNEDRLELRKEKKSLRSLSVSGRNLKTDLFAYTLKQVEKESKSVWIDEILCGFVFSLLSIHDINLSFDRHEKAAWIDKDRVKFPLVIRSPRSGDRFMPLGMRGTMKLKDFFVNNKVSPEMRRSIPVVESGGQIIWIAGMRIDQRVRITDATKNVLKMSFFSTNRTDQQNPEDL